EEQVARLHPGPCYAPTLTVEGVRTVWELDTQLPIDPVDEPGAVEAGGRRASPSIRRADRSDGDRGGALANGRLRNRWDRSVSSRCPSRGGRLSILMRECAGAAEDDRSEGERQQAAAEGARHEGERTTGRDSCDRAALACS